MKTAHCILLAVLLPFAAKGQGTATLTGSGNWTDATRWSSSPGGFAPNNGNNGQNWNATVNANSATMNANITIEALTFGGGTIGAGSNGTLTMNAASTWTGGNFTTSGVVNFNGGVAITLVGQSIDTRTVNLSGASTVGNGTLNMLNNSLLTNSGTFNINSSGSMAFNHAAGVTPTLSNSGTINKSGAGTASIFTRFDNTGTVNVDEGIMAVFSSLGGTATGTFDIDSGAEFQVASGNYTLNAGVQIDGASGLFNVTGGTAAFNGASTGSTGNLGIAGGTMTFNSGANFSTTGGFTGTSGVLNGAGTVTLGGASTWTGGNIGNNTTAGIVNFNGGVAITVSSQEIDKHTVNLGGTSSIGNGTIQMRNSGVLANSGTFNINNSGAMAFNHATGVTPTVSNSGTINKSGAGTASIFTRFDNTGTVNVDEGVMATFAGFGGTATGTFDIDSGAEFRVAGGNYTLNAGVQIDGASGLFNVTGGTAAFNGASTGSTGNLGIAGGTMTFNSGANFSTTGGFTGTSGVLNGAGTATFGGASTWTGGNIGNNTTAGTVNFNGGLAITISSMEIDKHVVNLGGTSSIGNGTIQMKNGGVLANNGTFNINNSGSLIFNYAAGTTPTVSNSGTINKSGAGTTSISGPFFSNIGTLNVNEGALTVSNTVTQLSGSTLTGGVWNVSGGSTLTLSTGSNITTLGSAASVTLDGATSTFNRVPTTASTLTTNQGSFTLKNDRDITTASAFTNSGTVSIQDSGTTLKIGATGNLAYTQTGGSTVLVNGAIIDASSFNLNGGTLSGVGTIDSTLTTTGSTIIGPGSSPGLLTINGNTTFGSGNTLFMEVGGLTPITEFDVLDVNGTLTLNGLLQIKFFGGFEALAEIYDSFAISTTNAPVLGSFSNVASGGWIWDVDHLRPFEVWYGTGSMFDANNITLRLVPEPSRALLLMAGLAGMLVRRRRRA